MTPVVLRSYREEVRQKRPWPEIVREFEADLYAVEFLVPFDLLETRPEYRFIREAWEQGPTSARAASGLAPTRWPTGSG